MCSSSARRALGGRTYTVELNGTDELAEFTSAPARTAFARHAGRPHPQPLWPADRVLRACACPRTRTLASFSLITRRRSPRRRRGDAPGGGLRDRDRLDGQRDPGGARLPRDRACRHRRRHAGASGAAPSTAAPAATLTPRPPPTARASRRRSLVMLNLLASTSLRSRRSRRARAARARHAPVRVFDMPPAPSRPPCRRADEPPPAYAYYSDACGSPC